MLNSDFWRVDDFSCKVTLSQWIRNQVTGSGFIRWLQPSWQTARWAGRTNGHWFFNKGPEAVSQPGYGDIFSHGDGLLPMMAWLAPDHRPPPTASTSAPHTPLPTMPHAPIACCCYIFKYSWRCATCWKYVCKMLKKLIFAFIFFLYWVYKMFQGLIGVIEVTIMFSCQVIHIYLVLLPVGPLWPKPEGALHP